MNSCNWNPSLLVNYLLDLIMSRRTKIWVAFTNEICVLQNNTFKRDEYVKVVAIYLNLWSMNHVNLNKASGEMCVSLETMLENEGCNTKPNLNPSLILAHP